MCNFSLPFQMYTESCHQSNFIYSWSCQLNKSRFHKISPRWQILSYVLISLMSLARYILGHVVHTLSRCHCTCCHCTRCQCTCCHCTRCHCTRCHCIRCRSTRCHCTRCHCTRCHCTRCASTLCRSTRCQSTRSLYTRGDAYLEYNNHVSCYTKITVQAKSDNMTNVELGLSIIVCLFIL